MNGEPDFVRIIRLHKKWADGYTLLSQLLILLLFAGVYLLAEQSGVGPAERTGALVFFATMVLATAIWQAVGLGVARVHMLLDGIDLVTKSKRDAARAQSGCNGPSRQAEHAGYSSRACMGCAGQRLGRSGALFRLGCGRAAYRRDVSLGHDGRKCVRSLRRRTAGLQRPPEACFRCRSHGSSPSPDFLAPIPPSHRLAFRRLHSSATARFSGLAERAFVACLLPVRGGARICSRFRRAGREHTVRQMEQVQQEEQSSSAAEAETTAGIQRRTVGETAALYFAVSAGAVIGSVLRALASMTVLAWIGRAFHGAPCS